MMGFLIPSVEGVCRCGGFLAKDFLGCLPPMCGFSVGLGACLPSMEHRSLPTAAIGLSLTGFLGVCLVLTIFICFWLLEAK